MIARQLKLMLRAFNGECDSIVSGVTWKNVVSLKERMQRSYDAVNKLGETQQCSIQPAYLKLKIEELQPRIRARRELNAEKEEQRALREQMREEEKAAKQLEKERAEAEGEEAKYQKALEKGSGGSQRGERHRARRARREDRQTYRNARSRPRAKGRRAVSQAELTRSGNVYVLSNEGTFGPNVFKVGLTRRLDPLDRVDELGDASVPFAFDGTRLFDQMTLRP